MSGRTINIGERDFVVDSSAYAHQPCKISNANFYPSAILLNSGKRDKAHFMFHPSTLKFVSCGNVSLTGIEPAFIQIVSIFEPNLWLCIASSYIIIAMLVHLKLSSHKTRLNNSSLLSVYKILVEQGDPIRESLFLFSPATRIVFSVALFGGLVLSTLFKNENITQITLPRQPKVLFNTLNSLLENDFTIYTRGTMGGQANIRLLSILSMAPELRTFMTLVEPKGNFSDHDFSSWFHSELYTYGKAENSWHNWISWFAPADVDFSDKILRLMNHTKLVPNWMKTLINFNKVNETLLENCNKTAVLLPDLAAHPYYYGLKKKKKSVFLGNDLKMSMAHGIKFNRRVNQQLLVRMQGLYSSGILDWWNTFMVDIMPRIQGGFLQDGIQPVKASDMDGNIVVVFVIFCVGILAGILTLIVETKVLIWLANSLCSPFKICYNYAVKCCVREYSLY